jgi:hypothetical protein
LAQADELAFERDGGVRLSRDLARRIAANIAKLPTLLKP